MDDNPIVIKSFAFAIRIIKLYRHLVEEHKEYTLSRELLVSGTHIGKHVKAAINGESPDFSQPNGSRIAEIFGDGVLVATHTLRGLHKRKRVRIYGRESD